MELFNGFGKKQLKNLICSSPYEIKKYQQNQLIYLQNELCHTMDIILDGQVAIKKIHENGKILTISVFGTQEIIGANLIFANTNKYPMTVIAVANTTIFHISEKLLLQLCHSNQHFMINLMREISNKSVILSEKINAISLKTIRQCLIEFLKYEYHLQKNNVIRLNISKKRLAERLGIERSSLSRELNKMRRDGLIEYDARTITLKNTDLIKD